MKQVTINNGKIGLTALDYGAVIQRLMVRNKNGRFINVVVGFDQPSDYLADQIALGASVGRFAGRISGGGFKLDGHHYKLHRENGVHLHGGLEGFSKKYWQLTELEEGETPKAIFQYISPHMEEGYPGELTAKVTYMLDGNALKVRYEASTDKTTVVNLTNHSYFRLDNEGDIGTHHLQLNCPSVLQTDHKLLPTGLLLPTENTELDFSNGKKIGKIRMDTPFVCERDQDSVGEIFSPESGIRMRIRSNQPAVVVYTPKEFAAICFETQNYPDAPNFSEFPSAVLKPGESYLNSSVFEFDLVN